MLGAMARIALAHNDAEGFSRIDRFFYRLFKPPRHDQRKSMALKNACRDAPRTQAGKTHNPMCSLVAKSSESALWGFLL
jgi:hypothetical protein